jgi:hypothetical protein
MLTLMRFNIALYLFLWYINIRLSGFFSESLPVAIAKERKRTEAMCRYAGLGCLEAQTVKFRILDEMEACRTTVSGGFCLGKLYILTDLKDFMRSMVAEASIPPGCVLRASLCIDIPGALPSTRETLYWFLSPLFFVPATLTGLRLFSDGCLTIVQVGILKLFALYLKFRIKRALLYGDVNCAKFLFYINDVTCSCVWRYALVLMYFMSFATWESWTVEEQVLSVFFMRNFIYVFMLIVTLASSTRPRRESAYLLCKTARLEIVENNLISIYIKNLSEIKKLSDHALFEVSQKLLRTKQLSLLQRKQVKRILTSRPTLLGILNFFQVTS